MERAGMAARDQVVPSVPFVLAGRDDGVELREFRGQGRVIVRHVASDFGQNLDGFFAPALREQVPWRLGQEADREEEQQERHDLEGQWEPPFEVAPVVAKTIADPVCNDDADVVGDKDERE